MDLNCIHEVTSYNSLRLNARGIEPMADSPSPHFPQTPESSGGEGAKKPSPFNLVSTTPHQSPQQAPALAKPDPAKPDPGLPKEKLPPQRPPRTSMRIEPREVPGQRNQPAPQLSVPTISDSASATIIPAPRSVPSPDQLTGKARSIPLAKNPVLIFECPRCDNALRIKNLQTYDWKPAPCPFCSAVIAPPTVRSPPMFKPLVLPSQLPPAAQPGPGQAIPNPFQTPPATQPGAQDVQTAPPPKPERKEIYRPDRDFSKFRFRSSNPRPRSRK